MNPDKDHEKADSDKIIELTSALGLSPELLQKLKDHHIDTILTLVGLPEKELREILTPEEYTMVDRKVFDFGLRLHLNDIDYVSMESACPSAEDAVHAWDPIWKASNSVVREMECSCCGRRTLFIL